MSYHYEQTDESTRMWRAEDGVHIDVRGLDHPEPIERLLELIDASEVGTAVIALFSYEPSFLYPEFDHRGWSYEISGAEDDDAECEDITLRLVRLA